MSILHPFFYLQKSEVQVAVRFIQKIVHVSFSIYFSSLNLVRHVCSLSLSRLVNKSLLNPLWKVFHVPTTFQHASHPFFVFLIVFIVPMKMQFIDWLLLSLLCTRYNESDLIKLDILINGDIVDPLATIVHKEKVIQVLLTSVSYSDSVMYL